MPDEASVASNSIKGCRIAAAHLCDRNAVFPVRMAALPCYCYAIELLDEEGSAALAESARLSRVIALERLAAGQQGA